MPELVLERLATLERLESGGLWAGFRWREAGGVCRGLLRGLVLERLAGLGLLEWGGLERATWT